MHRCRSHPSPLAPVLGELATLIEAVWHLEPGTGPCLVRARNLASGLGTAEVVLECSPQDDLIASLLGHVTPRGWEAVGVVASGTAYHCEEPGSSLGRVRVVMLCARDGTCASVLRVEGREPLARTFGPEPEEAGVIGDALRRSLRLPTVPPRAAVEVTLVDIWLHRLLARVHAGIAVASAAVDTLRPPAVESWTVLREQCGAGGWPELGLSGDLARWMDDGMFSRCCLSSFAEPGEVLDELDEVLSRDAFGHLYGAVVEMLGGAPEDSN